MGKHNCEKWFDEGIGCSICSCTLYKSPLKSKDDVKELQHYNNALVKELKGKLTQFIKEVDDLGFIWIETTKPANMKVVSRMKIDLLLEKWRGNEKRTRRKVM